MERLIYQSKMGNDLYQLIDIDHDDQHISLEEAVKDVVPFTK